MDIEIKFNNYIELVEIEKILLLGKYKPNGGELFYEHFTDTQIMSYFENNSYLVFSVNEANKEYGITCYNSISIHKYHYQEDKTKILHHFVKPTYKSRFIKK